MSIVEVTLIALRYYTCLVTRNTHFSTRSTLLSTHITRLSRRLSTRNSRRSIRSICLFTRSTCSTSLFITDRLFHFAQIRYFLSVNSY